jgi:hypothetical protein
MKTTTCPNCSRSLTEAKIHPLEMCLNLEVRLDPGSVVPDGECPYCGALVYFEHENKTETALRNLYKWVCDNFADEEWLDTDDSDDDSEGTWRSYLEMSEVKAAEEALGISSLPQTQSPSDK